VVCSGDACHTASCAPAEGCVIETLADGAPCGTGGSCSGGECVGSGPDNGNGDGNGANNGATGVGCGCNAQATSPALAVWALLFAGFVTIKAGRRSGR